jgi:protein-glutamine gamma-glutamyltransferase
VSPALARAKPLGVIALVIVAGGATYLIWRRRRVRRQSGTMVLDRVTRERMIATSMYELLETAMNAQGIPRGPSTPPLRHALSLQRMGHPLADEVFDLTQVYLSARFGGTAVTEGDRREFEGRVRKVRSVRPVARQTTGA